MSGRCFVDTNVLVYSVDGRFPEKRRRARALLSGLQADGTLVVSTQVLQEFYVAATHPRKVGLPTDLAEGMVRGLLLNRVVQVSPELVLAGIRRHRTDPISFWDALVVEAALADGCDQVYTEDLERGRRYGELVVVDPFV